MSMSMKVLVQRQNMEGKMKPFGDRQRATIVIAHMS